jgi:hypothetical protein
LYSLRAVKNLLPQQTLVTFYFARVHCHLNFAVEIWINANAGLVNGIYLMQKNAIRIISNAKYNAHTEPLFTQLNILKLPDLIELSRVKFMHNYVSKKLPISFNEIWKTNRERREDRMPANLNFNLATLRNEDDFYEPLSRLESVSNFPLYK